MADLQIKYDWPQERVGTVTKNLSQEDITTVQLLVENWEDAKDLIPTLGMKVMIEKELQQLGMDGAVTEKNKTHLLKSGI